MDYMESVNHYLFVAADTHHSSIGMPSAHEVAKHRLKNQAWGLNLCTSFVSALKPEDRAVVYISGRREFARHIVASATMSSAAKEVRSSKLRMRIDAPRNLGVILAPLAVELKNVKLFKHPVDIRSIAGALDFIKSPEPRRYGKYLQGGVRRISESDYNLIVRLAAKPSSYTKET
jgi:predicted RNA-binding protein